MGGTVALRSVNKKFPESYRSAANNLYDTQLYISSIYEQYSVVRSVCENCLSNMPEPGGKNSIEEKQKTIVHHR